MQPRRKIFQTAGRVGYQLRPVAATARPLPISFGHFFDSLSVLVVQSSILLTNVGWAAYKTDRKSSPAAGRSLSPEKPPVRKSSPTGSERLAAFNGRSRWRLRSRSPGTHP